MPGGPKPKVNALKLAEGADAYIRSADPPIIAEYAHMNGITREYIYQLADKERQAGRPQLAYALKKISEAKEVKLEQEALRGNYAANMAIFSLKQLGWRDRCEVENTHALTKLDHVIDALREQAEGGGADA